MIFSSSVFLFLFFPITLLVYYNPVIKTRKIKNVALLVGSLVFYAWGEPVFVFIMMGVILLNWTLSMVMARTKKMWNRKLCLLLAIGCDVGLLFVYKYLNFVMDNLHRFHIGEGFTPDIALPIGISFFTFQIISYIVDVYTGKVEVQHNLINLALYISLFPQLIAGPIVRYGQIADELNNRVETWDDFASGMRRLSVGLAKKVLLADYLGTIADYAWGMDDRTVAMAWLGSIAYTLQIFFDFSGYSEMAIGLGRMFGFHFEENFNYPYVAISIKDFWRRWHMSLSIWFRDYVYIPLGGNREGEGITIRNLFIVWLLTGIWHGANWTFIVWGIAYFLLLMLERRWNPAGKWSWFGHVYTLFWVNLLWAVFRADNLQTAGAFIGQMFGVGADGVWNAAFSEMVGMVWPVLAIAMICCFPIRKCVKQVWIKNVCCLMLFILAVAVSSKTAYSPFLYFNF